jgi:hypothetical protein
MAAIKTARRRSPPLRYDVAAEAFSHSSGIDFFLLVDVPALLGSLATTREKPNHSGKGFRLP